MKPTHIIALMFMIIFPGASSACSPGNLPLWMTAVVGNQRVKTNPDCSFRRAGKTMEDVGEGQPALDIGNGRVSQVVSFGEHSCMVDEFLIVQDCGTGDTVMLRGLIDPANDGGTGIQHSVRMLAERVAPLSFNEAVSLDAMSARAQQVGSSVSADVKDFLMPFRKKDRFDPNCGCKLFYPESTGAQN